MRPIVAKDIGCYDAWNSLREMPIESRHVWTWTRASLIAGNFGGECAQYLFVDLVSDMKFVLPAEAIGSHLHPK
jgi:hypothetical protein